MVLNSYALASGKDILDISYTHIKPDGNRLTNVKSNLPDSIPIDIKLNGSPVWVLGARGIWAVVLADGTVQGFRIKGTTVSEVKIRVDGVRTDAPPVLIITQKGPALVSSGFTSPMYTKSMGIAEIKHYQFFLDGKKIYNTPLYDSRILSDGSDGLLFLTGPTNGYKHGVLGDTTEASGFAVIKGGKVHTRANVQGGVIEGTSAIWADMDGDNEREVVLTISDLISGSRIELYSEEGKRVARGPSIGLGYRWRHQIAVAPFGPEGQMEIATVKTPHIGGTVEFFRMDGKRLKLAASIHGYSSHVIGLRNLDMAIAGDMDSDGRLELLVPTQSLNALAGIRRTGNRAIEAWRVMLPGRLTTNIAVGEMNSRGLIAAGTNEGILRIWGLKDKQED